MKHLLALSPLALSLLLPIGSAFAQELPGVRATLAVRSLVTIGADVELHLTLQVEQDAEVPSQLLTGANLTVRVDGEAGNPIKAPGKGGPVALSAGTRVDRVLTYPARSFLPNPDIDQVALVAVAWDGMPGVDCTFKVAPDTKNVKLEDLDLAKTEVVLVTNYGEMRLGFRPDKAPNTVENFVKLALSGFYDGTKFHRVMRNFMIQGGDPLTKDDDKKQQWGSGGPGYTIDEEFNELRHLKGTLSMARTSDPNSAGSGFFVVHKDAAHLDNQYTAFGNLLSGVDTLDAIANVPVGGPSRSLPLDPVILHAAIVLPVKK
jgi:peptidyl-prolyl cis-trans isomerase B (cyclophilin B)